MSHITIDANDVGSISDLQRLKDKFVSVSGADVTVDMSKLKKMSMLLLQILLAAKTKINDSGRSLTFTSESRGVLESLTSAGLGQLKDEICKDSTA